MLSRKQSNLVFVFLLCGSSAVFPLFQCMPVLAEPADLHASVAHDPCTAVEKLVREFYPKAVIDKGRSEIHFEFKSRKKNGFYPDRPAMVPADGGIVGTVTLTPGEYTGADKDQIPAEKPNGFYSVLTMAPYSKGQNSHLLAVVIFPQDGIQEFKERFKSLINSFNASEHQTQAPPEVSKVEATQSDKAATTPVEAAAAPAKAKPAFPWASVARPEYRLSFKFPPGFKAKDSADKTGTTWKGTAEGVDYTVTVCTPKTACITDDQRTQAMNTMLSGMSQGKKSKLEQAFNFQGLSAQEYTITDNAGVATKAIVCVSAGLQYLFAAGGQSYKSSKLPPEFFDGIKIGKIK